MTSRPEDAHGPVVSVVIATRNRPDLLRQCLESVAAQTYEAMEVLVCDDGSNAPTRATYATMSPALGGRLRWLLPAHPDTPGTGPAANRNRGLAAATGSYVAFCDDDDRWIRADHLTCAVSALEATGADFYFTDIRASRDGRVSDHVWFPRLAMLCAGPPVSQAPCRVFPVHLDTVLDVVAGTVIHPDSWVIRRSLLDDVGGFWERLWFPEDYNLMMRLLDRADQILFRPEACVDYRLPVGDAHSLRSSDLETILQEIMAAQHVRNVARLPVVRRHARAREAWGYRRLARQQRSSGERHEARRLAWQGMCTYATLGALWEWLSCFRPGRESSELA